MKRIIQELEPPYYAAMFKAPRGIGPADGRVRTAQEMVALATRNPGCLGIKTAHSQRGRQIVVSYWKDMESLYAWRDQGEMASALRGGADAWDEHLEELEVVRVSENPIVATSKRVAGTILNDGWGQTGMLIVAAAGFAYRTF